MPPADTQIRASVIRAFCELADNLDVIKLSEFHLYRENTVQSIVGDGEQQFPEIPLDGRLPEGKLRIELYLEEVQTERRVIVSASATVNEGGMLGDSSELEVSYIDTLPGEAGPGGEVPAEKFAPIIDRLPKVCSALISVLNAAMSLER